MARFADILSDETKRGCKIQTGEYLPFGKYPIIDQGQSQIAGYTNLENGLFKDIPTIIFGDHTRIVKYVDTPFFLGADGVKILKTKVNDADYKYLFYCLQNAKIPNTGYNRHFKWLKEIEIPLPPLEEQRKIAAVLDKISDLIAKRRTQLDKLDELVKSRFVEMFGDQKSNPLGWPQTTIGDCCTLKSGTSLPADRENEGGAIPYVKVADMNYPGNEQYITTSSRFVTEQTAGAGIFPVGTVIFPKRGGAIATNKKRLTTLPICADLNVMGVTAGNVLKSQYLMTYFDMVDLGALDNGSSVPQINNKDIAPLMICLPPLGLQEQFAAFVAQTDKSKLAIQKSLEKLEILKKALMQSFFSKE